MAIPEEDFVKRDLVKRYSAVRTIRSRSSIGIGVLACWITLLSLGLLSGCGASNPYPKGSFERAEFYADNQKNLEAVAALESYVRHNPTDSLAAEAQYLKSMVYMDMEEYPLAAVEFQILRKDYPTCSRIEDSYFQEGVAYFRQVGRIERDVTGAHEARLHFLKFSQEFPTSSFMPEVIDYMQQISDLMVRKRLQQAKVFRQLGRWEAVEVTLGIAMEEEGASNYLDEVIWERGRAAEKLWKVDLAAEMYENLINDYPDSKFTPRARAALKKLDEEPETELEDEET